MPRPDPHDAILADPPPRQAVDRRKFLLQLAILAGAGAVPFAGRRLWRGAERLEVSRPALGTWVRVVVNDHDAERSARAVEAAFAAIRRVDEQMSIHRPDSQLARVNAAAGKGTIPVDLATFRVTEAACAGARDTGGVYDPTVLPLMRLFGFYDSRVDHYPSDREIAATLDRTGARHVIFDRATRRIGLAKRGAGLDLGSIGKGWALDQAVDAIRATGLSSALVDVGGNVFGLGAPPERPEGWSVGVLHPATGRIDRTYVLRDRAVATSGLSEQTHLLGSARVGHILDARRGRPADGPLSVSVEALTGTMSDQLSTIAFLLGPDRFRGYPGALAAHWVG